MAARHQSTEPPRAARRALRSSARGRPWLPFALALPLLFGAAAVGAGTGATPPVRSSAPAEFAPVAVPGCWSVEEREAHEQESCEGPVRADLAAGRIGVQEALARLAGCDGAARPEAPASPSRSRAASLRRLRAAGLSADGIGAGPGTSLLARFREDAALRHAVAGAYGEDAARRLARLLDPADLDEPRALRLGEVVVIPNHAPALPRLTRDPLAPPSSPGKAPVALGAAEYDSRVGRDLAALEEARQRYLVSAAEANRHLASVRAAARSIRRLGEPDGRAAAAGLQAAADRAVLLARLENLRLQLGVHPLLYRMAARGVALATETDRACERVALRRQRWIYAGAGGVTGLVGAAGIVMAAGATGTLAGGVTVAAALEATLGAYLLASTERDGAAEREERTDGRIRLPEEALEQRFPFPESRTRLGRGQEGESGDGREVRYAEAGESADRGEGDEEGEETEEGGEEEEALEPRTNSVPPLLPPALPEALLELPPLLDPQATEELDELSLAEIQRRLDEFLALAAPAPRPRDDELLRPRSAEEMIQEARSALRLWMERRELSAGFGEFFVQAELEEAPQHRRPEILTRAHHRYLADREVYRGSRDLAALRDKIAARLVTHCRAGGARGDLALTACTDPTALSVVVIAAVRDAGVDAPEGGVVGVQSLGAELHPVVFFPATREVHSLVDGSLEQAVKGPIHHPASLYYGYLLEHGVQPDIDPEQHLLIAMPDPGAEPPPAECTPARRRGGISRVLDWLRSLVGIRSSAPPPTGCGEPLVGMPTGASGDSASAAGAGDASKDPAGAGSRRPAEDDQPAGEVERQGTDISVSVQIPRPAILTSGGGQSGGGSQGGGGQGQGSGSTGGGQAGGGSAGGGGEARGAGGGAQAGGAQAGGGDGAGSAGRSGGAGRGGGGAGETGGQGGASAGDSAAAGRAPDPSGAGSAAGSGGRGQGSGQGRGDSEQSRTTDPAPSRPDSAAGAAAAAGGEGEGGDGDGTGDGMGSAGEGGGGAPADLAQVARETVDMAKRHQNVRPLRTGPWRLRKDEAFAETPSARVLYADNDRALERFAAGERFITMSPAEDEEQRRMLEADAYPLFPTDTGCEAPGLPPRRVFRRALPAGPGFRYVYCDQDESLVIFRTREDARSYAALSAPDRPLYLVRLAAETLERLEGSPEIAAIRALLEDPNALRGYSAEEVDSMAAAAGVLITLQHTLESALVQSMEELESTGVRGHYYRLHRQVLRGPFFLSLSDAVYRLNRRLASDPLRALAWANALPPETRQGFFRLYHVLGGSMFWPERWALLEQRYGSTAAPPAAAGEADPDEVSLDFLQILSDPSRVRIDWRAEPRLSRATIRDRKPQQGEERAPDERPEPSEAEQVEKQDSTEHRKGGTRGEGRTGEGEGRGPVRGRRPMQMIMIRETPDSGDPDRLRLPDPNPTPPGGTRGKKQRREESATRQEPVLWVAPTTFADAVLSTWDRRIPAPAEAGRVPPLLRFEPRVRELFLRDLNKEGVYDGRLLAAMAVFTGGKWLDYREARAAMGGEWVRVRAYDTGRFSAKYSRTAPINDQDQIRAPNFFTHQGAVLPADLFEPLREAYTRRIHGIFDLSAEPAAQSPAALESLPLPDDSSGAARANLLRSLELIRQQTGARR